VQSACLGTFAVVDVADTAELPAGGDNPCNANPPIPSDIFTVYLPTVVK
jgi:hypothetical protein